MGILYYMLTHCHCYCSASLHLMFCLLVASACSMFASVTTAKRIHQILYDLNRKRNAQLILL